MCYFYCVWSKIVKIFYQQTDRSTDRQTYPLKLLPELKNLVQRLRFFSNPSQFCRLKSLVWSQVFHIYNKTNAHRHKNTDKHAYISVHTFQRLKFGTDSVSKILLIVCCLIIKTLKGLTLQVPAKNIVVLKGTVTVGYNLEPSVSVVILPLHPQAYCHWMSACMIVLLI